MDETDSGTKPIAPLTRRRFLWTGVKGAVAATAFGAALPKWASAQAALSPDAALRRLLAGNQRFVDKRLTSFDEDLAILKQNTVEKQEPFAAVLACADSRVPVELVFDQTIGHLFVVRVAGNVATSEIIASLEYGAAVLWDARDHGPGSRQLRCSQGYNRGKGCAGPNQSTLCATSSSG